MSAYEYVNGCYVVRTDIRDGYHRFHSMNAQYQIVGNNYYFVSYATPILFAHHDEKNDLWLFRFNGYPLGYSASTTRQIMRFIREYDMPITAQDIKDSYNEIIDTAYSNTRRIEFLDDSTMREYYFARF